MSTYKRRISYRKVLQTLVTLLVTSGCVYAISKAKNEHEKRHLAGVNILIKNSGRVQFISKAKVQEMLFVNRHLDPTAVPAAAVNTAAMEKILRSSPWISNANVYIDNQNLLHIGVTQRVPVLRIFQNDGASYYIDTALATLPVASGYTPYLPVISGVPVLNDDSSGRAVRGVLLYMSRLLAADTFWNAQISQLNMLDDGSFEARPMLGKQTLLLGDTARYENKTQQPFCILPGSAKQNWLG